MQTNQGQDDIIGLKDVKALMALIKEKILYNFTSFSQEVRNS